MANIMDLFSHATVADTSFDISGAKGIYERIKKAQDAVGGRPTLKAKVGAGGVKVFTISNGSRDIVMEKFQGIIVAHHKSNALFSDAENAEKMNLPPICSSTDGITGVNYETGECRECEKCPYNIFGTSGKGKACKNTHRLYILAEGSPIPVTLSLPPTSLDLWRNYAIMDVAAAGLDMAEVVTEFSLTNALNSAGQKYSIVNFKLIGKVDEETKEFCASVGGAIEQAPRLALTANEYTGEPESVLRQEDNGYTEYNGCTADFDNESGFVTEFEPQYEEVIEIDSL